LTYEGHIHNAAATSWFRQLDEHARLAFCRVTQLSLLRLLTTEAVMGNEVLSQDEAWDAYDVWTEDGRILFLDEPVTLEKYFRSFTRQERPSPKDWADSYLAAFASAAGLRIVTFDKGFRARIKDLVLLEP